MQLFKKVAIPNRGEIAVRIIKTLKEMNISSVLLHSSEDQNSMAFRYADEALCIGSVDVKDSYLHLPSIIEGALSSGACALHPGVGFLSESPLLAESCIKNNIVFIGPNTDHLKLFGNKIHALQHAQSLGIPILPSYSLHHDEKENSFVESAQKLQYPLMVKLAQGGGGVGLQKVTDPNDLSSAIQSVKRIGQNIFGSEEFFLEKYLPSARHIEVQIFGDSSGKIHHLFERDCSIQRRHQKIIEETPSSLPRSLVQKLIQSALNIGQSIQYRNAGTVEFLVKDDLFYFVEMNTRLQVEHPITEMVTGTDLVRSQILTAMGRPAFIQPSIQSKGHAIECRIYFQDIKNPRLGSIRWMTTPHSRLDMGYESYDQVPSYYDSMLGKIITWGENRTRAIEKMKCILQNSFVFGLPTNMSQLIQILSDIDFLENKFTIEFKPQIPHQNQLNKRDQEMIYQYCENIQNNKEEYDFNPWFHNWR